MDGPESLDVPPIRILVLLLAATLLSASATAEPPLDRPTWTPGDWWTYETNTTLTPGLNLTGEVTSTFQGNAPLAGPGVGAQAYDVLLSGSGAASGTVAASVGQVSVQGSWILTGEERFDPSTLQPVYSLLDLSVNGTYLGQLPFSIRVQNTTTFEILAGDWQYPLAVGSRGSLTLGYNFTQDIHGSLGMDVHDEGTGQWTVGLAMGSPASQVTPAGTFLVYPVTETWPDGSRERSFPSPQAGNDVRTESYGPNGNLSAVTRLVSYRYQALEPSTFLGLTALQWGIGVAVLAAAVVAIVAFRWTRRRRTRRPPEDPSSEETTSGPRGP